MARNPHPWFREERNSWYVMLHGKQRFLMEQPPDAAKPRKRAGKWNAPKAVMDEFHRLMLEKEPPKKVESASLALIVDKFLDWTSKHRSQGTYEWYLHRLTAFCKTVKDFSVDDLKPHHVQTWIDTKKSSSYKRGCAISICRAMNWAVKQGHIDRNPIAGMENVIRRVNLSQASAR